ncbi:hypothetical protein B296_00048831, partial [Ensete ventricosum]
AERKGGDRKAMAKPFARVAGHDQALYRDGRPRPGTCRSGRTRPAHKGQRSPVARP